MDHMKSFPSFTNPSKVIDTSSESFWKKIYILGTIDIAPITEKIRMWVIKFNKLVQLSQENSLESYWIICSWLFTIHYASLLCARENFWRARILYHVWACARAHFSFFRANMNLVCTKCNGARVSVWWTRAHKCDGWSYINMIDGCKKTYKKCARTNTIRAHVQISYGRVHKYHTCEHTNITRSGTQISHRRAHKFYTWAHRNSMCAHINVIHARV